MPVVADIRVESAADMDEKLDMAVATVRIDALADGTNGILVTRHDFGHFSVALSPNVPFGLTCEQDSAVRNSVN